MSTPARLAVFTFGLLAAFGAAFGVGRAVGPLDDPDPRDAPPGQVETDPVHGRDGSVQGAGSGPTTAEPGVGTVGSSAGSDDHGAHP